MRHTERWPSPSSDGPLTHQASPEQGGGDEERGREGGRREEREGTERYENAEGRKETDV